MPSKSSRKARSDVRKIGSIRIHSECPDNLPVIREAVGSLNFPKTINVTVQPIRLAASSLSEEMMRSLVQARLTDPARKDARAADSFTLRDYENRVLACISRARGVPYEGLGLMKFYRRLIPGADSFSDELNIVVTDRLIMTWSDDDLRYHARVAVFGSPTMISLSGIVEAPARPREYYLARQALGMVGSAAESERMLAEQFEGRYCEADDPRTSKILRGYMLQAFFHAAFGDPFCKNKRCMLYNSHWQEEMIAAQVASGKLCKRHADALQSL